jgi:DNA modification methylase
MSVTIIHDDCSHALRALPDASVDAVVTDPPYPRKYLPLYGAMAAELPRILKPGGSLLTIVPHYALPSVIADIGQHLKFRWLLAWHQGAPYASMAMGVRVHWKPIGWWVNGSWPRGRGFVDDALDTYGRQPSKCHHPWEQRLEWARYCLSFVPTGGTVLDPFMGSGTSGVACIGRDYPYIGIDNDPLAVAEARRRIAAAQQETARRRDPIN